MVFEAVTPWEELDSIHASIDAKKALKLPLGEAIPESMQECYKKLKEEILAAHERTLSSNKK